MRIVLANISHPAISSRIGCELINHHGYSSWHDKVIPLMISLPRQTAGQHHGQ
jgi:hypothetical protein